MVQGVLWIRGKGAALEIEKRFLEGERDTIRDLQTKLIKSTPRN